MPRPALRLASVLPTLPILAIFCACSSGAKATAEDCTTMADQMRVFALAERATTPEAKKEIEEVEHARWIEQCLAEPPAQKAVHCVIASKSSNQARLCDGSSATPPPAPPAPTRPLLRRQNPPGPPPGAGPRPGPPTVVGAVPNDGAPKDAKPAKPAAGDDKPATSADTAVAPDAKGEPPGAKGAATGEPKIDAKP